MAKVINRIKAVLAERNKTGKWLATVSKWCTNAVQPDLLMLSTIADVLNVSIRELLVDSKKDN